MTGHRANIPPGTVGGLRPIIGHQAAQEFEELLILGGRDERGLRAPQRRDLFNGYCCHSAA
jgi:hypothetical protein